MLDGIRESLDFSDDTADALSAAYDSFVDQFETSDGGSIKAGTGDREEALEDEGQEQIVKQKRG